MFDFTPKCRWISPWSKCPTHPVVEFIPRICDDGHASWCFSLAVHKACLVQFSARSGQSCNIRSLRTASPCFACTDVQSRNRYQGMDPCLETFFLKVNWSLLLSRKFDVTPSDTHQGFDLIFTWMELYIGLLIKLTMQCDTGFLIARRPCISQGADRRWSSRSTSVLLYVLAISMKC